MNKDIRLSIGFLDHPKTIKLKRILGWYGVESLMRLWFFAAQYKPDGYLLNLNNEDIEIAAKWNGKGGEFVKTLLDLKWIDFDGEFYCLHDWEEHNGFVATFNERSERAKKAIKARWDKKKSDGITDSGADSGAGDIYSTDKTAFVGGTDAPSNELSNELSDTSINTDSDTKSNTECNTSRITECITGRNTPSPSPSPSHISILSSLNSTQSSLKEKIPFQEIVNYLNFKTKKNFKADTKTTKRTIQARWNEGFRFSDFKKVIDIKTEKWISDPKMVDYLRPETLFGNKFEGYLNETDKNILQSIQPSIKILNEKDIYADF